MKANGLDPVKFIYALKDSTFTGRDRTKFFDFIIPVVPITSTSNSLDLILDRVHSIDLKRREFDSSFLRDVSEFIIDARLIHNVFNEFNIYLHDLNDFDLNPTKLLAVLIYKNSYGEDFQDLHESRGALFNLIAKKGELRSNQINAHKSNIANLKGKLKEADDEIASTETDLIRIYLAEVIKHAPQASSGIVINGQFILYSDINAFHDIEDLIDSNQLVFSSAANANRTTTNISFAQIERAVHPSANLIDRLETVKRKDKTHRAELQRKIQDQLSRIDQINRASLAELIPNSREIINDIYITSMKADVVENEAKEIEFQ